MISRRRLASRRGRHVLLRPSGGDTPAEMATSDMEEVNVLDEEEDSHIDPQSAASPPANAVTDHATDPAADRHDGNADITEAVSAAHAAPAPATAANGVAHAAGAATPQPSSGPQQPSNSDDDDDDLPLNARLLREPPSDAAGRGRQLGREGSADEGLEALGSIDSAAGMADAVISTVTGTSSVAAAAGAHLQGRRLSRRRPVHVCCTQSPATWSDAWCRVR